jgi:putative PEP-CTERM system histidine kinase
MTISLLTASFGLACGTALVSAALFLWFGWKSPARAALLFALTVSAAWTAVLALGNSQTLVVGHGFVLLEILRSAVWFFALRAIAGPTIPVWLSRGALGICVALGAAVVAGVMDPGATVNRSSILLACAGLVLIEQMLRNAPPSARRAVKLLALGTGAQFAYDLFLFSQAELVGGISPAAWAVRGLVVALMVPVAALGANRYAREEPLLFVSRQVVFYTTAFLALGTYLLVMGLGGYYVRRHGGTWGESLQLVFFVGAGIVLLTVLLSDTLWRRLVVFISKHFFRNKYDYRVEWLRFVRTLSSLANTDARHASIRAVAQIFRSPGGVLYLRGEAAQAFEAVAQWSESGAQLALPTALPVDSELAGFLAERNWVIDLREYQENPGLYGNIVLPDWLFDPRMSWRIVTPLLSDAALVGFLVLRTPPPPFEMTFEDRDVLQTAGRHVATLLAQQLADERLAESRQFDAFNRFAAFVMHDLKNSVAQLQLLVTNAQRHRHNPEFVDDAISTIANTADRMTRLIEQLQTRDAASQQRPVDLLKLLPGVAERSRARPPALQLEPPAGTDVHVIADPERLAAVFDHVVRNAQEAAGPAGSVKLELTAAAERATIAVVDSGPGMEAEFVRVRLFRPFDSTKGSKGMGIGAYQAREYVRQLGGEVEVQSSPGSGTRFLITLPLCRPTNPSS